MDRNIDQGVVVKKTGDNPARAALHVVGHRRREGGARAAEQHADGRGAGVCNHQIWVSVVIKKTYRHGVGVVAYGVGNLRGENAIAGGRQDADGVAAGIGHHNFLVGIQVKISQGNRGGIVSHVIGHGWPKAARAIVAQNTDVVGTPAWFMAPPGACKIRLSAHSYKEMKRRLRKKQRVGEFKELGFKIFADLRDGLSQEDFDAFLDRLILAVEARQLAVGGGGGREKVEFFVARAGRGSATHEDRAALTAFLACDLDVAQYQLGEFRDAWYGKI